MLRDLSVLSSETCQLLAPDTIPREPPARAIPASTRERVNKSVQGGEVGEDGVSTN